MASFLMGISCWTVSQYFSFMLDLNVKIVQVSQVLLSVILGLITYYISGIMMGIPVFRNSGKLINKLIKGKFKEEDEY